MEMSTEHEKFIELQQLDARKDEFIAMAGHELRTPLTAIRGFLELLEKRPQGFSPKQVEYLVGMRVAVDQLTQLVRDLMDTSKIRTGKLVLIKKRFDFGKLVAETCQVLGPRALARLRVKSQKPVILFADRGRIGQVLMNLLSNGLKYSPEPTKVFVTWKKVRGGVEFSVQDFGVGVKKSDQEHIFDPFYQGQNLASLGRGLGLGLFISSQVVKLHQGKIWVESKAGKGSTFKVFLPK